MPINDEIFARMDELSPAERKVARALLAAWPAAGLESAASLARSAGTSTPTVLRLASRLGFGSYPAFQTRLRDELADHLNSPVRRSQEGIAHGDGGTLGRAVADRVTLVDSIATSVPPSEFERAVAVLADRPKHVAVLGGYFSRYFAMLFAAQLDQILPSVAFVAEPLGHDVGAFLHLRRGSVVVVMDFRRHELVAQQAAEAAKRQGATVVLVTDTSLSPVVECADVVLPVRVDGIPFDSMAPLLVLIEALVEGVLRATGERGLERMRQWEDAVRITRAARPAHALGGPSDAGPREVGAGTVDADTLAAAGSES
jgi:DNA-binding MurR/RpiR family transcriptional regulator